ncbi:MAG TPA: serine hydrolase domain-containing protein, partial [Polyangiaceae bacterium]|nr:serine hydrolase domain-containing protein [Polyangiaceae bacterium]
GFSGAALITIEGERVLAGGYGLADRDDQVANSVDTAFDVGSIMKDFTAAAVFKLVGEGKLALSDRLGALFPEVPRDKADITLLQILQHRAGFDEYHDTHGDFEAMTQAEARQRIFAQELLFEPGSDEAYSNSGFTLLADVVQTVSGEAFTDYLRKSLFVPAGMQQTGFYSEPLWQTVNTAIGYDAQTFGENDPATWSYTWSLIGNGGLVTTVLDLDRWHTALWAGQVLPANVVESMRAEYLSPGAVMLGGHTLYAQAGAGDFGLGGVAADVPDVRTRLIIATNTYEVFDIEELARELGTLVLEEE